MGEPTIWKFPLDIDDHVVIRMPRGAEILSADAQSDTLCLWAIVDPSAPKADRHFFVRGTGHPMSVHVPVRHIDTVQMLGGTLVWHVFEPSSH